MQRISIALSALI